MSIFKFVKKVEEEAPKVKVSMFSCCPGNAVPQQKSSNAWTAVDQGLPDSDRQVLAIFANKTIMGTYSHTIGFATFQPQSGWDCLGNGYSKVIAWRDEDAETKAIRADKKLFERMLKE